MPFTNPVYIVAKTNEYKILTSNVNVPYKGVLEVRMFDVGEGEAILIIFPPSTAWLVDAGSTTEDDINKKLGEKMAEYLNKRNLVLAAIVASHRHEDHAGAFKYLIEKNPKITPTFQYLYAQHPPCKKQNWLKELEQVLREKNVDMFNLTDKDLRVNITDDTYLHLFAGTGQQDYTSVFIHLHYKKATFLFTGDAKISYENKLINRHKKDHFRSDVLKVTHHGSHTGTGQIFVEAVEPAIAIASTADDHSHDLAPSVKTGSPTVQYLRQKIMEI